MEILWLPTRAWRRRQKRRAQQRSYLPVVERLEELVLLNSPGTIVSDSTITGATWSNPGYAAASDNNYAIVTLDSFSYTVSQYLKATNFSFSIPSGATIRGVTAAVEAHTDNGVAYDSSVKLVKGGSVTGTDQALGPTGTIGTTDAVRTYGSSSSLWGASLTPSDINSSTFGVALAYDPPGLKDEVYVDNIAVQVYYSTSDTSLSASTNPAVFGQSVTLTAAVGDSGGVATPTGTVTFYDGRHVPGHRHACCRRPP